MNIHAFLQQHHHQHIIVGLSGGVDSVVLLHLLAKARATYGLTLTAVHVHHGLSANADAWADFCANLCAKWEILLHIKRVHVYPKHLGMEAAARLARYEALAEVGGDCVALAHHRDDQVETFLLAALRGAGVRGLAAMSDDEPALSPHLLSGSLKIARPLLHYARDEIEQYAAQHQLPHIEDESNQDPLFLRNWLRHHWLPPLRQRLPHADKHILAAVALLQDELQILDEINELDAQHIYENQRFHIAKWRQLSAVRRRQQLLWFAKRHGLGIPRRASVLDCERILLANDDGAQWSLPQGKAVAYRGVLFALKTDWQDDLAWRQALSGSLNVLSKLANLTFPYRQMGLPSEIWTQPNLTLRAAQPRDVLPMKVGRKSVKKLLAQRGVPPFLRAHYPVLVDKNGVCLAVVGLAVNQCVAVPNGLFPVCEDLRALMLNDEEGEFLN